MHVPATIKEVSDAQVMIDFNHQLAGKTLYFEVKIIEYSLRTEIPGQLRLRVRGDDCGDDCGSGCSC